MFGRLFSKENVKNALLKTLQGAVILAAPYFARSYLEKMEQSEKQEVKKEIRANESKPAAAQTDDVKGSLKTPKTNVRSDITGTVSKKVQQKVLKQKAYKAVATDKIVAKLRVKPNKKTDSRRYDRQRISLPSTLNK